jgi:hypothetical protein
MSKHNEYGARLQLFRYRGLTPPTETSHGWRVNVQGHVAALSFNDAVAKVEAEHVNVEIYGMHHEGVLLGVQVKVVGGSA